MKRNAWFVPLAFTLLLPLSAFAQAKPPPSPADGAPRALEPNAKAFEPNDPKARPAFPAEKRTLGFDERPLAAGPMRPIPPGRPPFVCPPMRGGPDAARCPAFCPLGILAVIALVHLLLAWWVSDDIRRRKTGSRVWTVIVLITGLFGAGVYALVRLGDRPTSS